MIRDILDAASDGGVTRTKIMYKAYLSFGQLKEYLSVLTDNGLLSYDTHTQTFKITEKGLRLLDAYNQTVSYHGSLLATAEGSTVGLAVRAVTNGQVMFPAPSAADPGLGIKAQPGSAVALSIRLSSGLK